MGVRWFWAHTQEDTHRKADTWLTARCSDPGRNPLAKRHIAGRASQRHEPVPRERPIYRGGGASRRLHKGGRPPSAAAPLCGFLIWVSPWVRVRVFGTPGQRCVVLPMGFSMGLSTQHWTICPLSYGCPPIKPARELEMSRPPKSTGGTLRPRIRNECSVSVC